MIPLLQDLGDYTRGCADAPPRRILHMFEEPNPKGQHPSHYFEGSSLCRADTHSYKGSGATVGYHNTGHPNLGIKTLSKTPTQSSD